MRATAAHDYCVFFDPNQRLQNLVLVVEFRSDLSKYRGFYATFNRSNIAFNQMKKH
jgi:hypothetical protein